MKISLTVLLCCCFLTIVSACSTNQGPTVSDQRALIEPVTCIAVLPVRTVADQDGSGLQATQMKLLRDGASYADTILLQELSGNENVRMVMPADLSNYNQDTISGISGIIDSVSNGMSCDAVLVTTMRKFRQRDGGAYAVDEPASASFDMRIFNAETKAVIWAADFNETQESFLSNIFSFGKAQQRGFKWITVEELVAQGMKERLAACPFFK